MVSFITIKIAAPIMPVQETIVMTDNSLPAIHTAPILTPVETINYLPYLLLAFYLLVSSILFYRFVRNLTNLLSNIRGNKMVNYSDATLVLTDNNTIPYSFLNYIFINRLKFEKGTIEREVLQHELTHVKQMHSLDVLFVEFIIAFAWFNPLLFLFRRAILLNHEFLADESVVETFNDATSYQLLLFKKANRKNNLVLTSSFNYLITKKRLIMMTRKTSQKVAIIKQIAVIPLIAALGFLFSTRVVAQDNTTLLKQKQQEEKNVNASQNVVDEYHAKLLQYGLITTEGNRNAGHKELSAAEKNELGALFMKMSEGQRSQQSIVFMTNFKSSLPKTVPTKEKFESWKNPSIYGVWIDGKKVDNAVLNKYTNTDFSFGSATYVAKNARIGKKYFMQVDLMTNAYYQNYRSETLAKQEKDKSKYMMGFKLKASDNEQLKKEKEAQILYDKKVNLNRELQNKLLFDQKIKLDKEQQAMMKDQKGEFDKLQADMNKMKAEMELKKLKMGKDQKGKIDQQQGDLNKLKAEMLLQKTLMSKELKSKLDAQQADMNKLKSEMELQKSKLYKDQKEKLDNEQTELNKMKTDMELQKAKLNQK